MRSYIKITPSVLFTHCLWPWGKLGKENERTGIAGTNRDEVTVNLHLEFSAAFFLAEIFEKVSFDPYNFRITRLSARKSEQMNFLGDKNMPIYTV